MADRKPQPAPAPLSEFDRALRVVAVPKSDVLKAERKAKGKNAGKRKAT